MIYAITVYDDFGPKLGLVVRKGLALLGMGSLKLDGALASRASLRLKVTQIGTRRDFFSPGLVTLALSGPHSYTGVVMLRRLLYWCG